MKTISFALVLLVASLNSLGQAKKAKSGYYYDLSGNKIEGDFVYRLPEYSKRKGELIVYKRGKKTDHFTAEDIQGFVMEGDSFASLSFNSQTFSLSNPVNEFVKTELEGEIDLYYLYYMKPDGYLIRGVVYKKELLDTPAKAMELAPQGLRFSYVVGKTTDGEGYFEYTSMGNSSKEKLIELVKDYEELAEDIEGMGKSEIYQTLSGLILRYNTWYISKN